MSVTSALPEAKRDVVFGALRSAFGAQAPAALQPVSGGASGALTLSADVAGRSYFVRVEMRQDSLRNPHQYTCMQIAADAGVAPPLVYLDAEAGIAIMEYVPNRPLSAYPGGPPALAAAVGTLIARLQHGAPFPALAPYRELLNRMVDAVVASSLFAPGLLDPHVRAFHQISVAYPWDRAALVASHNDPNAQNLLFDGHRLWLVDWETAYRNDPLTDVAIALENFAPTEALQEALLVAWAGRAPGQAVRARLALMRQITRFYYAVLIFSLVAGSPREAPETDLSAPSGDAFRAGVANGRLKLGEPETMLVLGKMLLASFHAGLSERAFQDALRYPF